MLALRALGTLKEQIRDGHVSASACKSVSGICLAALFCSVINTVILATFNYWPAIACMLLTTAATCASFGFYAAVDMLVPTEA